MLEIYEGALPTLDIYQKWENLASEKNFGALSVFTGIVREENEIVGLSFDIYEPLLKKWFHQWQHLALEQHFALIFMAHSRGDVLQGKSSFMCAISASQRKNVLSLYERFIENFKTNAPIWKYDLINGERIYALERSKPLIGSGLLR